MPDVDGSLKEIGYALDMSCLPVQNELCRNVCGPRYDTLDVSPR